LDYTPTLAWVAKDLRFPRRLCCDRERSAGGRCALASDMPLDQETIKKINNQYQILSDILSDIIRYYQILSELMSAAKPVF
jgi:hypothetical protein